VNSLNSSSGKLGLVVCVAAAGQELYHLHVVFFTYFVTESITASSLDLGHNHILSGTI
jgi:hypothetical protein